MMDAVSILISFGGVVLAALVLAWMIVTVALLVRINARLKALTGEKVPAADVDS